MKFSKVIVGLVVAARFAFSTGELWLLAKIKQEKIKKEG